jgi:hypothetical protein
MQTITILKNLYNIEKQSPMPLYRPMDEVRHKGRADSVTGMMYDDGEWRYWLKYKNLWAKEIDLRGLTRKNLGRGSNTKKSGSLNKNEYPTSTTNKQEEGCQIFKGQCVGSLTTTRTRLYGVPTGKKSQAFSFGDASANVWLICRRSRVFVFIRLGSFSCPKCDGTQINETKEPLRWAGSPTCSMWRAAQILGDNASRINQIRPLKQEPHFTYSLGQWVQFKHSSNLVGYIIGYRLLYDEWYYCLRHPWGWCFATVEDLVPCFDMEADDATA